MVLGVAVDLKRPNKSVEDSIIKISQLTKYPVMLANTFLYEPELLHVHKTPKYDSNT